MFTMLRRHVLYAEQERETSVGDHAGMANVLALWLARRQQFLHEDPQVARFLVLFWTLAKPPHATALSHREYVTFFQCVAKALVQSVGNDHAASVAARDWLYDCAGSYVVDDDDAASSIAMSLEQFREALFQCADLVLPVESDASMFASLFQELRDAVATHTTSSTTAADGVTIAPDARSYRLRSLRDVIKIRGAFLQKIPPNAEYLAQIRGLQSPDMDKMSLKQLLLSYNPRKFSLSRKFSSLFQTAPSPVATEPRASVAEPDARLFELVESSPVVSLSDASPLMPSSLVSRESDDAYDIEDAVVQSIESFPALRIAVVGPPGVGKSRVAVSLAKRLALQYVSMAMALDDAVASKKVRDATRLERLQAREDARETERAAAAELEAAVEASDEPTQVPGEAMCEVQQTAADEEPVDPAELLFGDAELAALLRGEALSTEKARPILVAFVRKTLLRGVGVVLDDVFPAEVDDELAIDYVVSLEMARDDARHHVAGFTLAPTSKRVYSARERAMLNECDATLRERGAMDSKGFVGDVEARADGNALLDEQHQRRIKVADAVAAAVAAFTASKAKPREDGEPEEGTSEPVPDPPGNPSEEEANLTALETAVIAQSPAHRNEIDPPDEPTVPLRSMLNDAFASRYREFEVRYEGLCSTARTQVIPVIAAQALVGVVSQCVVAITNNAQGICRAAVSRAVLPIPLPDEVAASGNRADQLRWLLFSDWTDVQAEMLPSAFAPGPADPQQPRTLSRWRDCCIVSSSSPNAKPVLGDPQYATYFCGHVYLFASATAREAFASAPLQYLRRRPPSLLPTRKLWVLSNGPLDPTIASGLAKLVGGDHVSASQLLTSQHSVQQILELVEGKSLAPSVVASIAADALHDQASWVLSDLVPVNEVLETLRDRQCLPDAIVVLAPDETDVTRMFKTHLECKRFALWMEGISRLSELLVALQLILPVIQSPLRVEPSETVAALSRMLSPLTPRVDTTDEGTQRQPAEMEAECARVFGSVSDPSETGEDPQSEGETSPRAPDPVRYDATQRAWMTNRTRMGETAQFCAVTWANKRQLVPGQPQFVASLQQKLYAFAGADELAKFERNPTKYIPSWAQATRGVVPMIWVLGVRGTDALQLARSTAETCSGRRIGVLDEALIAGRVERRLRAQLLLPLEKQTLLDGVYVDELAKELERMTASREWDVVLVTTVSSGAIQMPKQLDDDSESSPPTAGPPLPTPDLLVLCFQRHLFPTMVLQLQATEELIVQRQLRRWHDALPPARIRRKPAQADSNADANADDAEDAVDPAELETAETARLQEQFQVDQEALALAVETLRARGIAVESGVDINATSRAVVKSMVASVTTLLARSDSLFDYCERVSLSAAQKRLRTGDVVVGKHGMCCPVTGTTPSSPDGIALIYRKRLYFPSSMATLVKCEHAPAATMAEVPSQPPQCRVSCCVVGPPCVGKTRLAKQLASTFGLTYVSPHSAIDWILQCLEPQCSLWTRLHATRSTDWKQLDPSLVHEAIHTRLCSSDCQQNGWILDDYVATSDQVARSLDATGLTIHPGVMFVLEGTIQHVLSTGDIPNHERLVTGFSTWQTHRLDLIHTWTRTFGAFHIRQLDTDSSSAWQVHAQASDALQQHLSATRQYTNAISMGRPVRIFGVLRTQAMLESQIHDAYRSFCPVELSAGRYHTSIPEQRALCVECAEPDGRRIVVWLANERNVAVFCESPGRFLTAEASDRARELTSKAPVDASLLSLLSVADCEFPEMKGYCPVTFQRGTGDKDWQAIVKGSVFYRVSYENKVFFCLSERRRRAFLTQPTKYASLVLPIKLPPQLTTSVAFKNCPGRIEQELSGVLNETLLLLGTTRPKFVGVSTSASACFYLALLLKTRATKALPEHLRARYADQLRAFERDCRVSAQLKSLISPSSTATSCGPGIKGARAVRELSSVSSEVDLANPHRDIVHKDATSAADSVRQRFDELVGSARLTTATANQQSAASPRSNELFLEYAKTLIATHGSKS